MQNQVLGRAVAVRMQTAARAALAYKVLGRFAGRARRLNLESATRRSLVGAKGLRP